MAAWRATSRLSHQLRLLSSSTMSRMSSLVSLRPNSPLFLEYTPRLIGAPNTLGMSAFEPCDFLISENPNIL